MLTQRDELIDLLNHSQKTISLQIQNTEICIYMYMIVYFVKPGNVLNNYSNDVIINLKNETHPVQISAGKMQPGGLKHWGLACMDKMLKQKVFEAA